MSRLQSACAVLLGGVVLTAQADLPTSFAGSLQRDDDVAWFALMLDGLTPLDVHTSSYAAGGFAPVLSLFDAGGSLLRLDAGSSHACADPGAGAADPASGFCWDARFTTSLPAGSYTVALSQDGNQPLGATLPDGFSRSGQPDYTGLDALGLSGHPFTQIDGAQRSASWSLSFNLATVSAVPEPAGWALLLLGLAAAGAWPLRRDRMQPQGERP